VILNVVVVQLEVCKITSAFKPVWWCVEEKPELLGRCVRIYIPMLRHILHKLLCVY